MNALDFIPLLPWIVIGVCVGISIGAIPGLTGAMVIALTLPLTFSMAEDAALALLVSLYTGSVSGGLISATLLKIPGTPAAVITTLDGYPMASNGEPGKALGLGIGASFVGGIFSGIALWILARPVAEWSTKLSTFDLFALVVAAMVFIVFVSDPGWNGFWKSLFSGMAGCLLALPGMHPATGQLRFTFGFEAMNDGFKLLPVLIGLFAFSQAVMDLSERTGNGDREDSPRPSVSDRIFQPLKLWWNEAGNLIRSSFIGTFIGILPGIGANIGSTVAYGAARNLSKAPGEFGKGSEEGIVASESANNATVGGALIPLVSLGIPGSVIDAILLGAFVIHGLQPGPLLFKNHPGTVAAIIGSYLIANVVMLVAMLTTAKKVTLLSRVSKTKLAPIIIVFCVIGCYALANRPFDIWVMVAFGFLGIIFQTLKIPMAPFVIGFVLAPIAEENLNAGLMASGGSYAPLFTRPFPIICLAITVFLLVLSIRQNKKAPLTSA